jgi:hypothetical protein
MFERAKRWMSSPWWPWVAGLAALLLAAPTLGAGLMLDDYSLQLLRRPDWHVAGGPHGDWDLYRFHDGDLAGMREMMDRGMWPWWTAHGFKLAFLRPLSSLWLALDFSVLGRFPAAMHAESVLLLGAGAVLATRLYRRIFPEEAAWAAGLAGLLYAVDDAHSMPVVWLSNRNSLLAAALGLGALVLHDRGRRGGDRAAALLGPGCFALSLLAGEAALAAAGYLAAHVLFLDDAPWRKRLGALAPYAVVAAVYAVAYRALGYGAAGSGLYLDPVGEPLAFVGEAVWRLPAQLLGQLALPPADLWAAMPPPARPWAAVVAAAVLGPMGVVMWRALRGRREAGYFAVGLLLSVIPTCATLPNDRLLLFTGIGGFGLVAGLVRAARDHASEGRGVLAERGLAAALLVVHLVIAPPLLPLRAMSTADGFGGLGRRAEASLPRSAGAQGSGQRAGQEGAPARGADTLVIVNAPDALVSNIALAMRVLQGEPTPSRLRLLAVVIEGTQRLERPDDRTLAMTISAGLLHDPLGPVFRSPALRFRPGDRVTVEGMEVEIAEVLPDGRPTRLLFHFDRSLDDPSLTWIRWTRGRFERWTPIAVGATVELPAIDFMKALQNKE